MMENRLPSQRPVVRVFCDSASPKHRNGSRTWLVTFEREHTRIGDREWHTWREVSPSRSKPLQRDAAATVYLREDHPLTGWEASKAWQAHALGSVGATGRPPTADELAARPKVDRRCTRCGELLRVRMEDVLPVLDALHEAGQGRIGAQALRRLAGRV